MIEKQTQTDTGKQTDKRKDRHTQRQTQRPTDVGRDEQTGRVNERARGTGERLGLKGFAKNIDSEQKAETARGKKNNDMELRPPTWKRRHWDKEKKRTGTEKADS